MAVMSEGNGRATIREIAELAGVSIATVSRVVNGREDVSPETRELVQRVVRERGYTANRNARGLSAGKTGLIGATVPMLHHAYFSYILAVVLVHRRAEDEAHVLLVQPFGGAGEDVGEVHAPRPQPDDARAPPRGLAARAPDARNHRRCSDHPPRGV